MSALKISLLILLIFNCLPAKLIAQPLAPKDYGLKQFSLKDRSLGLIRFYVDIEDLNKKKPLFIEVNGSGGLPLCIYIKGKGFGATFNTFSVPLKDATKKDFHYIILDKPGTPFCDSISTSDDAEHYDKNALVSNYKFSKEYSKRLSLYWRVAATKKVITYMIQHGFWDGTQIVADGYSEGAQVVVLPFVNSSKLKLRRCFLCCCLSEIMLVSSKRLLGVGTEWLHTSRTELL